MPLPHELSDDIVPDSTAVVGDIESFIAYIEYGHAWQDWCGRVQQCVRWIAQDFGPVSDDIVQDLLQKALTHVPLIPTSPGFREARLLHASRTISLSAQVC